MEDPAVASYGCSKRETMRLSIGIGNALFSDNKRFSRVNFHHWLFFWEGHKIIVYIVVVDSYMYIYIYIVLAFLSDSKECDVLWRNERKRVAWLLD